MASEDTDDQFAEACSSSGLLCIHCNEDEVKWACNDCSREFCDRCKRIHLIADEETRDHHLYRYGSKRVSGSNVPDVIHHSELSVNEARPPRVKFKPVVESRVSEFKPKTSLVENSTVQHIRITEGKWRRMAEMRGHLRGACITCCRRKLPSENTRGQCYSRFCCDFKKRNYFLKNTQ